jgi:hypothetical protein
MYDLQSIDEGRVSTEGTLRLERDGFAEQPMRHR